MILQCQPDLVMEHRLQGPTAVVAQVSCPLWLFQRILIAINTENMDSDPFLDSTTARGRTVVLNEGAHNLRISDGPQPGEDPSSPSPKRREPLRPLTASLPQGQSDKPDAVPPTPASPTPVGPSLPPPPPLPPKPTIGSREEAAPCNGLVGGQQNRGDWADRSCQIGGGYLHPFHRPGQYFPYQGGDHGLVPPHGMPDPRGAVPYRDSPNVYHEEAYRGHPHGYGGFFPGFIPPGAHQDMRGSSPFFQNPVDHAYHQLQPRNSRSPTCEPHQVYSPYASHPSDEPPAPSSSANGAK